VEWLRFVRPEQKFDGIEALKAQIAKDCETARGLVE
jgi:riboflavin kinase/FMN adenylyltransferase